MYATGPWEPVPILITGRTNPYVDQRERTAEAACLLLRLLAGERCEKTCLRLPIATPTVTLLTARDAYADMTAVSRPRRGDPWGFMPESLSR